MAGTPRASSAELVTRADRDAQPQRTAADSSQGKNQRERQTPSPTTMENVAGAGSAGSDSSNSKRKLDLAHSTPMTVLSMDSQSKVRRRGSSMSSNDSTVMKRSLSDGTMYVNSCQSACDSISKMLTRTSSLPETSNGRVFSDVSDSEQDTDDGGAANSIASCPISPASTGSDSVNEATAQLHAMSPRDTIPVAVVRSSPFSPVFPSPSRNVELDGSAWNSSVQSPFRPSPVRNPTSSVPSSGCAEEFQQRLSAPAAFSVGLAAPVHPTAAASTNSGGRGPSGTKRSWQPVRKGPNPGNLSLDLTQMEPPALDTGEGNTHRRNDQAAVCSQVTDFLYIGGAAAAKDRGNLHQVGITHIINCAANIAPSFFPDEFQYYNIKLRDHSGQDITRYFYNVFDFIEKARRRGGKVFVHCVKGISRSPTMAIAYLMWFKGMTMLKALDFVRQARPAVDPNTGFIFQLNEWEHLRANGLLSGRPAVVFQIDVPDGSSGTGNDARAAEKPLIIGPLTSITEAQLLQPASDSTVHKSCFVVSSAEFTFLWCGSQVNEVHVEAAQQAITLLQTFESVPAKYEIVVSGCESLTFWSLLDAQHPHTSE